MRTRYAIAAVVFMLAATSCKKNLAPNPTFTLQYTSDKGNVSETYLINDAYDQNNMGINAGSQTDTTLSRDSVNMAFNSNLRPHENGGAYIQINHSYAKSQMNRDILNWTFKNDGDFYSAFNNSLRPYKTGPNSTNANSIDIGILPANSTHMYHLYKNADDPNISITATYHDEDLDWFPFWQKYFGTVPDALSFPALVTITFSGKLVNDQLDTMTIQNFTYQGPFMYYK